MSITSAQPIQIASRSKRIGAFMIDHITLTFMMVAVAFLSVGSDFMSGDGAEEMVAVMWGVMIPGLILYLGKDSIGGISFGKWVIGLMVRDVSNPDEIPSVARLFLRNVTLVVWPLEVIILATSQDKRRLGDRIAKCIVVENPKRPKSMAIVIACLTIGVAFLFLHFCLLQAP